MILVGQCSLLRSMTPRPMLSLSLRCLHPPTHICFPEPHILPYNPSPCRSQPPIVPLHDLVFPNEASAFIPPQRILIPFPYVRVHGFDVVTFHDLRSAYRVQQSSSNTCATIRREKKKSRDVELRGRRFGEEQGGRCRWQKVELTANRAYNVGFVRIREVCDWRMRRVIIDCHP